MKETKNKSRHMANHESVPVTSAATTSRLKDFRSLLKRSVLLTKAENLLLDTIPDILLDRILTKNFNGNMAFAERVMFNKYHEIDKLDIPALEQKKQNIKNLDKATMEIRSYLSQDKKVLFLTDNDNDGSMAQSVFLEFFHALPEHLKHNVQRAYAQPIGTSRGLNKENIDVLFDYLGWRYDDVLVVTADIGINNGLEQKRILESYKNVRLVVTDHHLPVKGHVVEENKNTVIFNPQYAPTDYFKKKNISGANTLSVLLKNVLQTWKEEDEYFDPVGLSQALKNMNEISSWSNLLDYVEADVADMPLRPYTIEKALSLRALLNVSNSMGPLVTLDWTEKEWNDFAVDVPGFDINILKKAVNEVKNLNLVAQKLLAFENKFTSSTSLTEKSFYDLLAETLSEDGDFFDSPNPNYIAQLRPHIFRFAAIDNKFVFLDLLKDQMVLLYEDLRKVEKNLTTELRKFDLLDQIRNEHSAFVYPKSPALTRLLSRKLLGKIYNEENNGFYVIMDKTSSGEFSGSLRSLFPMSDVLPDEDKARLENDLGVNIEILGHAKAAGFKVIARPGSVVTPGTIQALNDFIGNRIGELKMLEKDLSLPFLSIDFGSLSLVQKINTAVKAHLSNMNGLPVVLKLGQSGKTNVWITDSETAKQVNLSELVKNKKYGYQPIQASFDGSSFIIPVEQLRSIVESKYNLVAKMSYMDDGVFIAHEVGDPKLIKNMIDFKGDRSDQRDLIGYYWDTYRESNFIPLSRDDIKSVPYFRYNSYGESEFDHFEQLIIGILDRTERDVLAVIDTEGTGLGQAPKCFNIGGTNIRIKDHSGFVLSEDDFNQRMYRDEAGQSFLVQEDDIKNLEIDQDEIKNLDAASIAKVWKIYKGNESGGSEHEKEIFLKQKPDSTLKLINYTRKGTEVFCNRSIEGVAFSYLIRDDDFAITPELENLTGISHDMAQRFGTTTSDVDDQLVDFYKTMKNSNGQPAKVIFSAHNLPYDKGVIASNFSKLNDLMEEEVLCDTAKLARKAKLAYDATPVSSLEKVPGIPAKVYFYDSPFSSYSLTTFLDRAQRGRGGVYPDTSGRYLLRFNAEDETLSFIDKQEINEILIDSSPEELVSRKKTGEMPSNAVKYSVERLSSRAMIRNIILHDYTKPTRATLSADESVFEKALEAFQDQYHFDNSLEENVRFFQISRHNKNDLLTKDMLLSVGMRFLDLNKSTQAKFHDGWIYEKVLSFYEPAINEGKISQDVIHQINYYTDLPRKKIEKVFQDTINFKKKFGLTSALVHEQHNNIRQHSVDGHGLSDTAIESVLANLLAMMTYYNPYNHSSDEAVNAIIETNMKASMQQLLVKAEHQDLAAVDSFSMKQMKSFDREIKTKLVERAQNLFDGGGFENGQPKHIRFKLKADTLPPGSGIYGIAKKPLTPEELKESAEKLEFILLNEQLRTASTLARNISVDYGEKMRAIAAANDQKSQEYKNSLMTLFDKIEFQRKEKTIKALSEMMADAFQGIRPRITSSLASEIRKNPELIMTVAALQVTHHEIDKRLGKPFFLSPETAEIVSDFINDLTSIVDDPAEAQSKFGGKMKNKNILTEYIPSYNGSPVRDENFLPDLDIRRDEPLKFILNQAGPKFLGEYIRLQDPNLEMESETEKDVSPRFGM